MTPPNVFTLLEQAASRFGDAPALHQPTGAASGPSYLTYSWTQFCHASREIAVGLRKLGIERGDIVAVDAETRAEFYLADFGIMGAGAIAAALYTSYPPAEHVKTLRSCDAKLVFVDTPKTFSALMNAGAGDLAVRWILLTGEVSGVMGLGELRRLGQQELAADPTAFDRMHAQVKPEDYAILYLTSGATGEPKMGLVRHGALVENIEMGPKVIDLGPEDVILAFLPSAHIAQRIGVELLSVRCGVPTWFSEGLARLPHEMQNVRPTFFLAPPRVWERIYSSVCTEIRKRGPAMRRVFWGALGLGLKAAQLRREGKPVPAWMARMLTLADKVVFQKLRSRFGGRMRLAVSGAAPLGKDLAQFYEAIGMPLIEGYGLTEGGITTLNPVHAPKPGSIGKMLPGVLYKFTEDGELCLGGPTIFAGYYKDPDTTAQVLRDGWLHTGDLAEVDAEGYFYITGRKKEMIVSSNGKKVYPSRLENLLKMEPIFNQIVLIGDKRPYVSALFTINVAAAESLKGMEGHKGRPMSELVTAEPVQAEVKRAVQKANKQLAAFEQIRKFRILERELSIEHGELTATMKVRRGKVMENFQSIISELYVGKEEMN
ncbi:MAG: AMP-binding protein [Bryobacteraceae bacterium]|nr:AMP-binding protein [Bryobacteraceae bacterium]MDW8376860.1 AMP-binding protein [Bryobacterales bacterium]